MSRTTLRNTLVAALALGAAMNAAAGLFGLGGTSWKEEVLLHDGTKIIVERSLSHGGQHEVGQSGSINGQEITFTTPNAHKSITFKDEYDEDIGRNNFHLLALHLLNGTPYIVAEPNLCLAYNKWGRPNPPYVLFRHDGKAWQRIPMNELPVEFKDLNVTIYLGSQDVAAMVKKGLVSADEIKKRNSELTQYPHFKTILREPMKNPGGSCAEMIFGGIDSGWHGVGLFGKTHDTCMKYCKRKKISPQYCPCETLFKGEK